MLWILQGLVYTCDQGPWGKKPNKKQKQKQKQNKLWLFVGGGPKTITKRNPCHLFKVLVTCYSLFNNDIDSIGINICW